MATLKHIPICLQEDKCPSNSMLRDIIGAFLTKEWPLVEPDALTVDYHTCFANVNCHVQRPKPTASAPEEPLKVFVKLHRASSEVKIFKHLMPTKHAEAVLCHEYAQTGRGALMYGFFQTKDGTFGRIDEFLDSRIMLPEDAEDAVLRSEVAEAFASFHSMNHSLELQPVDSFYAAIMGGLGTLQGSDKLKSIGKAGGVDVDRLIDYDFATRVGKIADKLASIGAKTGLCINDVAYMNVLVKNAPLKDGESRVALIDFEFALHNYRAFDIAAHFAEKTFTWSEEESKGAERRKYTDDEKRLFCEAYARRWNQSTGGADTAEQVFLEAQHGSMLSIAWNVYNMLCVVEDQGEKGSCNLSGLNNLLEEFEAQFTQLGLNN